jgi:hypothetical protein
MIRRRFELTRVLLSMPPFAPKSGLMTAQRVRGRIEVNSVVAYWATEPTGSRRSVTASSSSTNRAVGHVLRQRAGRTGMVGLLDLP